MLRLKNHITIVIPCKNEVDFILHLLTDLNAQFGISGTKVYIADAGSTDGTVDIVDKNKEQLNNLDIKIVKGGLPSVGRNAGAKLALTDYVLFIDADIRIPSVILVYESFSEMVLHNLDMLTTNIRCIDGNWKGKLYYYCASMAQKISSIIWKPLATGMFMMVKKSTFDTLGGFVDDIQFAEDYHFSRKINKNKFKILDEHVLSSDRRIRRMGFFRPVWLSFLTFMDESNESRYKKDVGYWDHLKERNEDN